MVACKYVQASRLRSLVAREAARNCLGSARGISGYVSLMLLRQIFDPQLAQYAYLLGCQQSEQALIVDPERDIDRYRELAEANGLRISAVAETHIHADFVSGAQEFAEDHNIHLYLSGDGWTGLGLPVARTATKHTFSQAWRSVHDWQDSRRGGSHAGPYTRALVLSNH